MSDLLVATFATADAAKHGARDVATMEKEGLIAVEDAVVAIRKANRNIEVSQLANPFWQIRADASGNPAPAVSGPLTDFGSNTRFVEDIAEAIPQGGAGLFVLLSKAASEHVIKRLTKAGGAVLCTPYDTSAGNSIRAALVTRHN
jgi:uncharacterized membrane protein